MNEISQGCCKDVTEQTKVAPFVKRVESAEGDFRQSVNSPYFLGDATNVAPGGLLGDSPWV